MNPRRRANGKPIAPIRVAVVGLGIGRMHLEHLRALPEAEIAGVCDADRARLRKICRDFAVPGTTDLGELLCTIAPDAIVVATPNFLHEEMVLAGLEAGCHVLCEKPLAHSLDSALRIERAARGTRRVNMLDLSFRFGAAARTAKAFVEAGELGTLYHAHSVWARSRGIPFFGAWFTERSKSGGGPVVDLAIHRLDLALWLLGEPQVLAVSAAVHGKLGASLAARRKVKFDVEDLGVALLRLRGGQSLLLEASWAENSGRTERMCTRLLGVHGGVEHENLGDGYEFCARLWKDRAGKRSAADPRRYRREATTPVAQFLATIRGEQTGVPTFRTGLQLQRILHALYVSSTEACEVQLAELPGRSRERS